MAASSAPALARTAASSTISLGPAMVSLGHAAPASVLGLDSDDAKAGGALTKSLRSAFANRGLSGGEELSLVELRLTMGCENDAPACLAEGGRNLGVDKLVYGYLEPTSGGDYQLELLVLDVASGDVEHQTSTPVRGEDLEPDRIDATAVAIVNSLFPEESDDEPLPTPTATPTPIPTDDRPAAAPKQRRGVYFGLEDDTPRWKWVGFGVGTAFAVVGLTAALVFGIPAYRSQNRRGRLYEELVEAADESLADENPANDIDPRETTPDNRPIDLCATAEAHTDPANPDAVHNASMTEICRRGRVYATVGTAGWAVFGVGAASALLFTGLLLIHRKDAPEPRDARLRSFGLGAAPTPTGGVAVSSSFRF